MDIFHGEFAEARKKFFTGNGKTVRVGQREIVKGFDGKLQGKLTRRSFYWKKPPISRLPQAIKRLLWRNPSTIREEPCWCFGISGALLLGACFSIEVRSG